MKKYKLSMTDGATQFIVYVHKENVAQEVKDAINDGMTTILIETITKE